MNHKALKLAAVFLCLALTSVARAGTWNAQDYDLYPGDFDGDSFTDILYVAKDPNLPSGVALGPYGDAGRWPSNYLGIQWSGGAYTPVVADFNADGKSDIFMQRNSPGDSYLLLTRLYGGEVLQIAWAISQTIPYNCAGVNWTADQHKLHFGDFTGDGKLDLFLQATDPAGTNAVVSVGFEQYPIGVHPSGSYIYGTRIAPCSSWNVTQYWTDAANGMGFKWSTKNSVITAGDFNGDNKTDLLIQAKPKIVMIDYEIPIPVPVYEPGSFGVAISIGGGQPFQDYGMLRWDRNYLGLDWSPQNYNVIAGNFDSNAGHDIILQSRTSGRPSYLLSGNTSGQIFTLSSLASNVSWSADSTRIIPAHIATGSYSTSNAVILQPASGAGGLIYATDIATGSATVAAFLEELSFVGVPENAVGRVAGNLNVSQSGKISYSIPLELPPGINGLTPKLALTYTQGDRTSGPFGMAMRITGVSSITRCRKTIAQDGAPSGVTLSPSDAYCFNGNKMRLVSGSPGDEGAVYRTESELFSRIVAHRAVNQHGPEWFEAWGKDGLIYEFGGDHANTISVIPYTSAIYSWSQSKVRDRAGNEITFKYKVLDWQQRRVGDLSEVRYAGYEIYTADVETSGISIHPALSGPPAYVGQRNPAIFSYSISYLPNSSNTGKQIASVSRCDANGNCVPATRFQWSGDTAFGLSDPENAPNSLPTSVANRYVLDLNGDGYQDVMHFNDTWRVQWGSSAGPGPVVDTAIAAQSVGGFSPAPLGAPIDVDSDGRTDLVFASGSTWYWLRYQSEGVFASFDLGIEVKLDSSWFGLPPARPTAADINGDGYLDLVSSEGFYIYVNFHNADGSAGFGSTVTANAVNTPEAFVEWGGPYVTDLQAGRGRSSHDHYDIDGDGRDDLAVQLDQGTMFLHSTGTGFDYAGGGYYYGYTVIPIQANRDACMDFFMQKQTQIQPNNALGGLLTSSCERGQGFLSTPLIASSGGGHGRFFVLDWDGDGVDNVLIAYDGAWGVATPVPYPGTSTGGALYPYYDQRFNVQQSAGPPLSADISNAIIIDFDGKGAMDFVYTDASGVTKIQKHRSEPAPDISRISDGFGNVTTINYAMSNDTAAGCYARDASIATPQLPVKPMTAPQRVVCSVTSNDGAGGNYTLSYNYYNANTHVQGRGYLGFQRRSITDSRTNIIRDEWYSQTFPFTGMATRTLERQQSGTPIRDTYVTPATRDFSHAGGLSRYAYPQKTETYTYEVGGTRNGQLLSYQKNEVNALDDYGNATDVTAEVQDKDTLLAYDQSYKTRIVQTIDNNVGDQWCLGRSRRTETTTTLPDNTSSTEVVVRDIDYDKCRINDELTNANAQGQPTSLSVNTHYDYAPEACGNVSAVTVTGRRADNTALPSRMTSFNYGSACRFPETITDALGKQTTRVYDYNLGVLKEETDPNNRLTKWEYDGFGRRKKETRPDGTSTTVDFSQCNSLNNYCGVSDLRMRVETVQRDTAGNPIRTSYDYLDGFGRTRIEDEPLPVSGALSHVVSTYDARGRLATRSAPYTSSFQGRTVYDYDLIGRQTSAKLYNSGGTLVRESSMRYEGRRRVSKDPRGNETVKFFDVSGQLRKAFDPTVSAGAACGSGSGPVCYDYTFEAGGVLKATVTDAKNNQLVTRANQSGHKIQTVDPDMGTWSFEYTSLGELTRQADAKGQWTTFADYDELGRPTMRREYENASTYTQTDWTYGTTADHAYGQVKSVTSAGYTETYDYDSIGRPSATHVTIPQVVAGETTQFHVNIDYHPTTGFVDTVTYPEGTAGTRVKVKYAYDQGVQTQARDYTNNIDGTVFWQLNATDARGHSTDESLGNGMRVVTGFDPTTGLMTSRQSGAASSTTNRQNLSYLWDASGNLERRTDNNQAGLYEHFNYDALNRLDYSTLNGSTNLDMSYDEIGNIVQKTSPDSAANVGTYNYTTQQSGCAYNFSHSQPHAVRNAGGSVYCYDANGNMTARPGIELTWNSDNTVKKIRRTDNSIWSEFFYTPDGQRYRQRAQYASGSEDTIYIAGMMEKVTIASGETAYRHYIGAGSNAVIHTRWSNGTVQTFYATTDHIGSSSIVTDQAGSVVVNESFDAFGKRRGSNWAGLPSTGDMQAIANTTRMGYTGHEHLDNLGLIHMNGRVQDPMLGRFVSADPLIQEPEFSQSLNRYSYVWNNPLSMNDPSGFQACVEGDPVDENGNCLGEITVTACGPGMERLPNGDCAYVVTPSDPEPDCMICGPPPGPDMDALAREAGITALGFVPVVGQIMGVYDAYKTLKDPNASKMDKFLAIAGIIPGGKLLKFGNRVTKVFKGGNTAKEIAKRAPAPNGGLAKPHGGEAHNRAIDQRVEKLRQDPDVSNVRKNQQQTDVNGNKVGTNRPDLQYDRCGVHHCVEYDTVPANSTRHGDVIRGNDPNANVELNQL